MIQRKDIKQYEEYIIQMRRDIHMHPETGFQEFRTSKLIEEQLLQFGYEIETGIGVTGLTAKLVGNKQGKTVGLRADIDALNMQEELETEYKSQNDGIMHSCGHDTHTAMLLGAAKYFSDHKEDLNGTVKLFFQSAEEGPMPGGGIYMVEGGHVDECDAVFGQHIVTRDELHSINIKKGPAMAAPDEFKITVTGIGTHASAPQTGVDAILCSADIIQSLQMITSRNISALENAVISVSTIHGGTAFNILPDKVEMTGTIRTLKPNIREFVFKRMTEIVESVGKTHNATAEIEIIPAYPPVINDPEMCDFVLHIAKELNLPTYELDEPSMGGEDFAYYLQKKPGAFLWLGAQRPNSTNYAYNHNPLFDPDEDALLTGMLMHVNIVTEFLK